MSDLLDRQAARQQQIERYAHGARAVYDVIAGATEADLDRVPAGGGWTARQVIHHLADAETMSSVRLRKLLGEDESRIEAYDENHYARVLHYDRPVGPALQVVSAVRALNAQLLGELPDEAWGRTGTHSEDGPYSVERWLAIYTDHPRDHAEQITRSLEGEG